MADANSLQENVSGVQSNGDPEMWRLVKARQERKIGDVVNDPTRGPWYSEHNGKRYVGTFDAFEQIVVTAEQLGWVHTFSDGIKRDPGDILIEVMEFVIAQRKAAGVPTSAK